MLAIEYPVIGTIGPYETLAGVEGGTLGAIKDKPIDLLQAGGATEKISCLGSVSSGGAKT